MARLSLNQMDSNVTFKENVPGVTSTVFEIEVPEKIVYTLYDGAPLIMQLRDEDGNHIPHESEIVIAGIRPGRRIPVEIDGKDYRPWAALDLNDQYDTNKNNALRLEIAGGRLDLLELHKLLIQVNSTAVVAFTNSFFEIELDYAPYRDR